MNDSIVLTALQESVVQAVEQSVLPLLPVKYVNVTFTKPDDGKWLELVHIPNPPPDIAWGDEKVFRGIFRLILHWPNNGAGAITPLTVCESISSSYSKYKSIDNKLVLLNRPKVSNLIEIDEGLIIPITLEYSSFSP